MYTNFSLIVEGEVRVVLLEETLQELCFAQVELIEWVLLTVLVEVLMDVECVRRPVPQVDDRL